MPLSVAQRAAEGRSQARRGPGGGAEEQRVGDGVRRPLGPGVGQRGVQGVGLRQRQGGPEGRPHGPR